MDQISIWNKKRIKSLKWYSKSMSVLNDKQEKWKSQKKMKNSKIARE